MQVPVAMATRVIVAHFHLYGSLHFRPAFIPGLENVRDA